MTQIQETPKKITNKIPNVINVKKYAPIRMDADTIVLIYRNEYYKID